MQEVEARRLAAPRKEREKLLAELHALRQKTSSASGGGGSGGVSEDTEELRKLAVAVDNFQNAVEDVGRFQKNFSRLVHACSLPAKLREEQQRRLRAGDHDDGEGAADPVRLLLASVNLRKSELRREVARNRGKLAVVKNQVYRNVQALAKGPPPSSSPFQ